MRWSASVAAVLALCLTATLIKAGQGASPADQPAPRADRNSMLAHEQLLEKRKKGRIDVYFEGDSITRRWGTSDEQYRAFLENWRRNFFGWNAADFGWGGDTTQNILWRLHNGELDGVNPRVIVLMAGTNNVGNKSPQGDEEARAADVARGLKAVLELCRRKAPEATIILMGITPRNDNMAVMPVVNRINEKIAKFADGKRVRYLNINDRLADKDGRLYEGMAVKDGLHLDVKGYQVWADALKPILTELLGPPAKEDHAPPPTGDPSAVRHASHAEDGYRLWLRYDPLPADAVRGYRARVTAFVVQGQSPTLDAVRAELEQGCGELFGGPVPFDEKVERDGAVVVGTPRSSPLIDGLGWRRRLAALGPEGFRIRSFKLGARTVTVIASDGETGALYGAFHFLRLMQTLQPISGLDVSERPRLGLRVLNHWDNLDGTIERGYAGRSLWDWDALPGKVDPRLHDYARANASIGINGSVLNNVNADSKNLSAEYLQKTRAIADLFRPYGVRVYLSARFSAPMELGGLKTADPLDPEVAAWWKRKADEIYRLIPDFGGLLVKANSEGQPGPRTYGRDHVDGANMLAAAVAPHGGVVIWRAFVYDAKPGYDRAAAAYDQLQPFDGRFAPNVLLQVKNGPIDFQPREPFHPLFGAMPKTQIMLEAQITQEYTGQSNHLVFLAPMWREVLDSDTHAAGPGSTVTKVLDGSLFGQRLTGMAGVANTGSDMNWTGHHFAQANWYAFGRLAWNPDTPSKQIADEWVKMTFTRDPKAAAVIERIMLESYDAMVDYMTPLGLHHIMWGGHHYGPAPWEHQFQRADWNPVYYHRADDAGLGFDRTPTGSNAVAQYRPAVRALFGDPASTPEKYLLWFHHVPWDGRMRSGRTLWDELALDYQRGVDWVRAARKDWDALAGSIDPERHAEVARKLAVQERDAVWWRDSCLLYFQTFSRRPLPAGVERPQKTLAEYEAKSLLEVDSSNR